MVRTERLYGHKAATQLIKFTPGFPHDRIVGAADAVLDKFGLMSNSGGFVGTRWFPLFDRPRSGGVLQDAAADRRPARELVATIPMDVRGQGIAWDRSDPAVILRRRAGDV